MLIEAQGYLDFSYLTAHAMGIVTDSGNVAEEGKQGQRSKGIDAIFLPSPGSGIPMNENAELEIVTLSVVAHPQLFTDNAMRQLVAR